MRQNTLLLLVLLGCTFVLADFTTNSLAIPSPLVMWSTEKLLHDKSIQENLYTQSLVDAIRMLTEINPVVSSNDLLRKHGWTAPDVVVIYLVSELSTVAFRSQDNTNIKLAVRSAADSQLAAYFFQDASDSLEATLSIATQLTAPIAADSLADFLAAKSDHTRVLVIHAASLDLADDSVAQVSQALARTKLQSLSILASSGAVFSDAYVSQQPDEQSSLLQADASRRVLRDDPNVTTTAPVTTVPSDCTDTTCYNTYWPADVSSGLIVGLLIVIILIVALSTMLSLQSPERFEGSQKRVFVSRVQPR